MKQNTCSFIKLSQDQYLKQLKHTNKLLSHLLRTNYINLGKSKLYHSFNVLCQSNLHATMFGILIYSI